MPKTTEDINRELLDVLIERLPFLAFEWRYSSGVDYNNIMILCGNVTTVSIAIVNLNAVVIPTRQHSARYDTVDGWDIDNIIPEIITALLTYGGESARNTIMAEMARKLF